MSLFGEITAIKKVKKGENIGYGCDHTLEKDSMIATVALGYGMGVPRCIEKSFKPCVHGARVPFASRICMDRFMLDLTELFEKGYTVRVGETVELFGKSIPVTELSESEGTIPYETLCRTGKMNSK
jgi:alanine racemase